MKKIKKNKITIIGAGYVGIANGILLAKNNEVVFLDNDDEKVRKINNKISPIKDELITEYLKTVKLKIHATTNLKEACEASEYIVIALPTDYNEFNNSLNTQLIEKIIIKVLEINENAFVVIKSTIPLGFINKIRKKLKNNNIIFSPEFLREGFALHDNLNPSRIVVGDNSKKAIDFANLMAQGASIKNVPILTTGTTEAESIKLFSNTYLAMRVAFFNELDNYALKNNLDVKNIIEGMSLDERIGNHYNNPSFGYGGYCLPKDTKQLLSNYNKVPQKLITAIVESNKIRKETIAKHILNLKPKTVGVYRLIMKADSDNFRESSIIDIIKLITKNKINVIIYEPKIIDDNYLDIKVINDLNLFKRKSEIIIANRITEEIVDVKNKIFSRDLFGIDK